MKNTKGTTTKIFTISMPVDDYKKLNTLGGDNRSAFIRRLVRKEWDRNNKKARSNHEVVEVEA